jgi:hypothetical protein
MSDPRFDPAFQRGYDGPEPELVVRPAPGVAEAVRDFTPPTHADAPAPAAERVTPAAAESAPGEAETIVDSPPDGSAQQPRRNPFSVALLVSGLALIVIGLAMIWSFATRQITVDETGTTFDVGSQALAILNYLLPPALLLGGVLALVAWLILGALGASGGRSRT